MRILIVEDNALVALDLEQQLLDLGHEVVGIATTASEAERMGRTRGADLALMDVLLADGSSGVDAAERLKNECGIPSVYTTATLPDSPEAKRHGIGHLKKPFTQEQVTRALHSVEAVLTGREPQAPVSAGFVLF